jgi:hypothetical protein
MSTDFTVEISQNEYLAEGAEDVNAIVTVTSPDTGLAAPVDDQGSAEIIIIDCSGSMRSPRIKIEQARAATAAAVDVVDAASGTVQLKKRVDDADEMALDTRSTKTVRTKK